MEAASTRLARFRSVKERFGRNLKFVRDAEVEKQTLCMRHGNLDAIVASHQDTILRPPQMRDAYREPDADGQKGKGKSERRHIRQHALSILVAVILAIALVMGQIPRDLKLADGLGALALGDGSARPRPKLEHAVLHIWWGRNDRPLGFHGNTRSGTVRRFVACWRCISQ
jgi:hypothetical protein